MKAKCKLNSIYGKMVTDMIRPESLTKEGLIKEARYWEQTAAEQREKARYWEQKYNELMRKISEIVKEMKY